MLSAEEILTDTSICITVTWSFQFCQSSLDCKVNYFFWLQTQRSTPKSVQEIYMKVHLKLNPVSVECRYVKIIYYFINLGPFYCFCCLFVFPNNVKNPVQGFSNSMAKLLECMQWYTVATSYFICSVGISLLTRC